MKREGEVIRIHIVGSRLLLDIRRSVSWNITTEEMYIIEVQAIFNAACN